MQRRIITVEGNIGSGKTSFAKKIIVPYDREKNTVLVCNAALNMFRIFIEENS